MLRFEKVEEKSYNIEVCNLNDDTFVGETAYRLDCYNDIKLPQRATEGSAGYDFYAPYDLHCLADRWYTIPLGIKFVTDRKDIVLLCLPRSGLGFKYNWVLSNSVGVIDSDYQYAENDGHIMVKFRVNQDLDIKKGQAILQGIFTTYIKVDGDDVDEKRVGGFGSTSKDSSNS